MRRRRLLSCIALVASVLFLVACGKSSTPLPKIDAGATIVAFGDSLTYGTGAEPEESYPAVLEKLIGRKVVAAGVPGEVTSEGLERLPEVLDEHQPQLLILCLGGNDLLRKMDETALASNLRAMVKLARDRGIAVVMLAPPRPALLASSAPEFYGQIAKDMKLPLEGEVMKQVLSDNSLKADLIHPNAKGYARIAEAVAKLLKSSGAF